MSQTGSAAENDREPAFTRDVVAKLLQNVQLKPRRQREVEVGSLQWAFREQAAVRAYYEPSELAPAGLEGSVADQPVIERLLAESSVVYDERNQPHWMLRNEVRKSALQRLAARGELQSTMSANPPAVRSSLQTMLEAYSLTGPAPAPLAQQNLDQLSATLQVVDWLAGCVDGLPDPEEVRRLIDRERLLKPFRYLAGDYFRGRRKELEKLRNYVGVLPPGSARASFSRGVRMFFSLHEKPPLLIFGPGGMGKSTLVARFILEHTLLPEGQQFPYVYLDFDRPDLAFEEPLTLLLEAVRQLSIQYPVDQARWERARQEWQDRMDRADIDIFETTKQVNLNSAAFRRREWERYFEEFKLLLDSIDAGQRPLLLVLDTFEEVQYRSRDFVAELWDFLDQLQSHVPRLRTVLAGRARIDYFKTEKLLLDSLDEEAAQGFLQARGLTDPQLAAQVVKRVGRSPLSLSLAADLLIRQGAALDELDNLGGSGLVFFRMQENLIQGQLYRRILNHIHDERVQKLAHPGLVLHRITPELILKVLAGPCEVDVPDLAAAEELYYALEQEISLVTRDDQGRALRHRPDVRRVMLDLLRQDEPVRVEQIHHLAAAYYRKKAGSAARAEEIYHRLSLGEDPALLDERWMPGIERHLRAAIEELPVRAQTFLASRVGIELPEEIWAEAELSDWERRSERRARDLLVLDRPEEALKVLAERSGRTVNSPLPLLEAQAHHALGRLPEARQATARGIGLTAPNTAGMLELLLLSARLDQQTGEYGAAMVTLTAALQLADRLGDDVRRLEISLARFRLGRLGRDPADPLAPRLKAEFLSNWNALPDDLLVQQSRLLREAASLVGLEEPELVRRVVRLAGLSGTKPAQTGALGGALAAWDEECSRAAGQEPGMLARLVDAKVIKDDLPKSWTEFLAHSEWERVAKALERLVESQSLSPLIANELVSLLQSRLVLTSQQVKELTQALLSAYPVPDVLARLVRDFLGVELESIVAPGSLSSQIAGLVSWAESNNRILDLVAAALSDNPGSQDLRHFAAGAGLAIAAPETALSQLVDPLEWRKRLERIESAVCRVEVAGRAFGTGFLIGPRHVLTCFSVLATELKEADGATQVAVRFDFKVAGDGTTLNPGQVYLLDTEWRVVSPVDELDFALLRVAGAPGLDPASGQPRGEPRGWLTPAENYLFQPGEPLSIAHHLNGGPLKLTLSAQAVVAASPDGRRITYRIETGPGSAGAPCFNQQLDVVALHSRKSETPSIKTGIPTAAILAQLRANGTWPL